MKRFIALAIAMTACVPAPKKSYTPAEISAVGDIQELMRIHAKNADPLFSIRDEATFSEDEFARMKQAGDLIQATSTQLGERFAPSYDPGFGELAKQLGEHARALSTAATAKDAAAAGAALTGMKDTCSSCHGTYR